MKENYTGDNAKLETALEAYCEANLKKAAQTGFSKKCCNITNLRKVFALCDIAELDSKLCVLVSDSGLGKTAALREYTNRKKGTIMIEVDPTYNSKRFFKVMHKALGMSGKGLLEDIFQECLDDLHGTDRIVIVDEAELLSHKTLELLRRLHDKSEVGIVVAGMPRLIENIRGIRSEFAQWYTRVGASMRLEKYTADDVDIVVHEHLGSDISDDVVDSFYNESRQNGRHLSMLIFQTIRICDRNNVKITPDIIKKAAHIIEV
jgi:DNA transposition AAA+ family ATPase